MGSSILPALKRWRDHGRRFNCIARGVCRQVPPCAGPLVQQWPGSLAPTCRTAHLSHSFAISPARSAHTRGLLERWMGCAALLVFTAGAGRVFDLSSPLVQTADAGLGHAAADGAGNFFDVAPVGHPAA